ncbi:hypothetical protein, partial [Aeromonas hydrophila]
MNKAILALLLGWTCLWTNIAQAKDLANKPIAIIEQYASLGDVDAQIFLSKLYYEDKNYKLAETHVQDLKRRVHLKRLPRSCSVSTFSA